MTAVEVRSQFVEALRLDLVGPEENLGAPEEVLPEPPSRWYLTGFLVPLNADENQKSDEAGTDELDTVNDAKGLDDAGTPEKGPARRSFFPSSVGLSFLVPDTTKQFRVVVRWGDYKPEKLADGGALFIWRRASRSEMLVLKVPTQTTQPVEKDVPNSGGLKTALSVRPVESDGKDGGIPKGTLSVSLFVVNRRKPAPDEEQDTAWAFQAKLEVETDESFVARPNLRSLESGSYAPNAWGLYDMHGNVWQWCSDWYDPGFYKNSAKEDPKGPEKGVLSTGFNQQFYRVARGGCWLDEGPGCRAAYRFRFTPDFPNRLVGFRVVGIVK